MKMKPTITVADNGNLQIHIPMLIRRMRGRKTVIAPLFSWAKRLISKKNVRLRHRAMT
ncbi:MAG: hypothetical protein SWC40_06900 [Thermodesulfobacteriota bacterium]|nr:hypothetical protein [Thermodesulfobacteriota bacterium]